MPVTMNPYLNFAGNTREAMEFYHSIFGGDLTVYSIVMIAMGVIEIVTATFGIRGANNPRKIGGFRVLSVFAIVIDALNIGSSAMSNPASLAQPTSLIVYASLVLSVAGFVASGRVVKELDR